MPRSDRRGLGDGIFHVTARGNRRQEIFFGERDYWMYLSLLGRVVKNYRWLCSAYCLMPNHLHLVVECPNEALSQGMHRLQGTYAQWFNGRHRLDGHLFQDRFAADLVDNEGHWIETPRYVVLNPVRAGICEHPDEWPWSSYNATVGSAPAPTFLAVERALAPFSSDEREAQRAYAAYVAEGIGACPGTGLGVRAAATKRRKPNAVS